MLSRVQRKRKKKKKTYLKADFLKHLRFLLFPWANVSVAEGSVLQWLLMFLLLLLLLSHHGGSANRSMVLVVVAAIADH